MSQSESFFVKGASKEVLWPRDAKRKLFYDYWKLSDYFLATAATLFILFKKPENEPLLIF